MNLINLLKPALVAFLGASAFLAPQIVHASVIDFETHQTRNNFRSLGIANTYQGYTWGYGTSGGFTAAKMPAPESMGWAFHTATNTASGPMPVGGSGSVAAWNWNGTQSLWIDFRTATDFTSGKFAYLSPSFGSNAESVQLFGYNASKGLVGSSSVLNLSGGFQKLDAKFEDITFLEIRANANSRWFSVDDLVLNENPAAVPEPASLALLSLGAAGLGIITRRRRKQAA